MKTNFTGFTSGQAARNQQQERKWNSMTAPFSRDSQLAIGGSSV
jgi:hypothetical protein